MARKAAVKKTGAKVSPKDRAKAQENRIRKKLASDILGYMSYGWMRSKVPFETDDETLGYCVRAMRAKLAEQLGMEDVNLNLIKEGIDEPT
jgi:hypothetical protein